MSRRVIVLPAAESDITAAAIWYEEREPDLGLGLLDELGAAMTRAAGNPLLHLRLRQRPEVRRVLARRFPYRIFFLVQEDAIVIFAVLHAARHERHWRQRI